MTELSNGVDERDRQDIKKLAEIIKDSHCEPIFNASIGIAISAYINGVLDTCKSFKAAQSPA